MFGLNGLGPRGLAETRAANGSDDGGGVALDGCCCMVDGTGVVDCDGRFGGLREERASKFDLDAADTCCAGLNPGAAGDGDDGI